MHHKSIRIPIIKIVINQIYQSLFFTLQFEKQTRNTSVYYILIYLILEKFATKYYKISNQSLSVGD